MKNFGIFFLFIFYLVALHTFVYGRVYLAAPGMPLLVQSDSIPKRNLHGKARRTDLYPLDVKKYLTGVWKGTSVCNDDTFHAPSAITISSKDSAHVYVSGLPYSKPRVTCVVNGNIIFFKRQKIKPGKRNAELVNGQLMLVNNYNTLRGTYTIKHDGRTDSCAVIYHALP